MRPSTLTRRQRKLLRLVMGDPVIGARVKRVRKSMALTQADFAEAIGLETGQAVSNIERGESAVTIGRARELARLSGKPVSYFLDASFQKEEDTEPVVTGEPTWAADLRVEVAETRQLLERIEAGLVEAGLLPG